MSKRINKRQKLKTDLSICKQQLTFFRGETIRLRKMLKDTTSKKIQNLGKFELVPEDGKPIPLKVKEKLEVGL